MGVMLRMNRQISIIVLPDDASSFISPFEEDYALLLVIASPLVSLGQRDGITSGIVNSRCQYALTFGHDCEIWHDIIDETCVGDGAGEERFIMTTWHDDEPIEDVIDFLWWNTSYEEFESERLSVVLIGVDFELESAIRHRLAYHQKQEAEQFGSSNGG
jgi:hypothetical protein